MERLQRILKLMKDSDYVTRPREPLPPEAEMGMSPGDSEALGKPLPGQQPNPGQVPLKPEAMDSMIASLNAQGRGDVSPPPEPQANAVPKARRKLDYLNTMRQVQKSQFPEMESKPALGGGSGGLRI